MTFDAEDYRSLEGLTKEMADAARAQDIETLTLLAAGYATLSARVTDAGDVPAESTEPVRIAIQNILDHQRQIVEHAGPWLDDVRKLLRNNRQERSVIDAYRNST